MSRIRFFVTKTFITLIPCTSFPPSRFPLLRPVSPFSASRPDWQHATTRGASSGSFPAATSSHFLRFFLSSSSLHPVFFDAGGLAARDDAGSIGRELFSREQQPFSRIPPFFFLFPSSLLRRGLGLAARRLVHLTLLGLNTFEVEILSFLSGHSKSFCKKENKRAMVIVSSQDQH
ncbi:hypothetical protein H6P81_014508 [Aristolochia fimbriata]|uniref:Uncharacterized protein n=1 Tax=Aristolochia fimbriata TaxID=158543 RepID=A0AAV7EHQ7_ARIFI|nr:hypothetical protein H6P81_014508 [Aristolochia fimbriata]